MPDVVGVFPVRAAFPASVVGQAAPVEVVRPRQRTPAQRGRARVQRQRRTVALLDTGVDLAHPYLRGKVLPGFDIVNGNDEAGAVRNPQDTGEIERHGTELAGLVAGAGGPGGLEGAAPGATILPIRVAGWQPTAGGRLLVYARTDQLIAGLERAVDPNGDGDTHDAVRVEPNAWWCCRSSSFGWSCSGLGVAAAVLDLDLGVLVLHGVLAVLLDVLARDTLTNLTWPAETGTVSEPEIEGRRGSRRAPMEPPRPVMSTWQPTM